MALITFLILATLATTQAWTFIPLSTKDLVSTSNSIAVGFTLALANEGTSSTSGVWTTYQLNVTSWLKLGSFSSSDSLINVSLLGGLDQSTGLTLHVPGTPEFTIGDKGIFFIRTIQNQDGTIRHTLNEFAQGYFNVLLVNGVSIAVRPYELPRDETSDVLVRRFDQFTQWISNTVAGINLPEVDLISLPVSLNSLVHDLLRPRFNTMTDGTRPLRWANFDAGNTVSWYRSPQGQNNFNGGGFTELQQSFDSWNNNAYTPIMYSLAGQTSSIKGLNQSDGVNSALFNDPGNSIPGSFNCQSGGTLAIGGFWYGGATHTFRGITFRTIIEGDLIIQDGISCYTNAYSNPSATFSNVITHELGHTLGLAHSCGDSSSGSCVTNSDQDKAIMRAYARPNGGYVLGVDDNNGIQYLYSTCHPNCGSSGSGTPTQSTTKAPSTPLPSTTSTTNCASNSQRCISSTQYQSCVSPLLGSNYWGNAQSCPSGKTCSSPSYNQIQCA